MAKTVPFTFQSEAAECGLACATMIANFHGNGVDLSELRRQYSTSLAGLTLRSLIVVLEEIGFSTRPLRVEPEYLSSLTKPCILHWGMNHFVVLTSANGKMVTINDPAVGKQTYTQQQAREFITGIALECSPKADFVRSTPAPVLRISELWKPAHGFPNAIMALLCLIASSEILALAAPFVTQLVLDRAIPSGDRTTLATLVSALAFMIVLSAGLQLWKTVFSARLSSHVSLSIERNVFNHLLRLPTVFFENRSLGDTINRLDSIQPIRAFVANDAALLAVNLVVLLATTVILLLYQPAMFTIPLASLLLVTGIKIFGVRLIGSRTGEVIRADARERSLLIETIRSHRAIKLFGRELERLLLWQNVVSAQIRAMLRLANTDSTISAILTTVLGLEGSALLFFGGTLVADQKITIGVFVAFLTYAGTFTSRGNSVLEQFQSFRMLSLHKGRLADIVKSPRESVTRSLMPREQRINMIRADGIHFRYSRFTKPLLDNVSLDIGNGSFILLSGPSGGGKTTLFKLLTGLLRPEKGELLVDGIGVDAFGLEGYRQRIGVVMQDDTLLTGTITENVSFFDSRVDHRRVSDVCGIVGLSIEIERMPMGYRSYIGDMGSILSGGQRQRLLIARALYRDPDVLFLDEGTANLDFDNEFRLLTALRASGRSVVMVSHSALTRTFCTEHWEVADGSLKRSIESPGGHHFSLSGGGSK